jgi:hypothetical protein
MVLDVISNMSENLANWDEATLAFSPYYSPWYTVLSALILRLFFGAPDEAVKEHLSEAIECWLCLASGLKFQKQITQGHIQCGYSRCFDRFSGGHANLTCKRCLQVNYCSAYCQKGLVALSRS